LDITPDLWYPKLLMFLQTSQWRVGVTVEEAVVFLRKAKPYYLIKRLLHKQGIDG
jgi:hypothetical protein